MNDYKYNNFLKKVQLQKSTVFRKEAGACGTIHCDVTQKPGEKEGWCNTVITVADNRKGSFARTFARAKALFLFAFCKKAHPLPQRNRMRVFFANKYVKID